MSKFITQNPAKSRRKEASRARKLAVWGDMPRRDRRQHTTAGHRDMIRSDLRIFAGLKRLGGNRKQNNNVNAGATIITNVSDKPHSSYLDAIGVQEPTPRQIAARKAAATRAANKAAKSV